MGLDMYLRAEKYVARVDYNAFDRETMEFPPTNPMFDAIIEATNSAPLIDPSDWTGIKVEIPIGYWRKANQIHSYFVENFANGVDECQPIGVAATELRVLRDVCSEVLDDYKNTGSTDLAEHYLPCRSGSFFGSYEYDEYYYADIENTIAICNRALDEPDCDLFVYQASW